MPLIHDDNELMLWEITETERELATLTAESDRASAARFGSPRRRIEHLAWRAALRSALPDAHVVYNDVGRPLLDGEEKYLGVAHTDGLAAVMVSPEPCAVDVERVDRVFGTTCARFITPREMTLPDAARADFAAAVWCARETLYKLSGRRGLDLLRDLEIVGSDLEHGFITGRMAGSAEISMRVMRVAGYMVVHTA